RDRDHRHLQCLRWQWVGRDGERRLPVRPRERLPLQSVPWAHIADRAWQRHIPEPLAVNGAGLARLERGQSTVELAIMLPLLVILLIGIVDVGVGINAYATVTNASREGAMYAVLHPNASPAAIVSAATSRSAPLAGVSVSTSYYSSASATFVPWPSGGL